MAENIVAQLRQAQQRLDAEIARFSDEELLRNGHSWAEQSKAVGDLLGDWSVKDVMAHLGAWDAWLKRAVEELLQKGQIPIEMLREARNPDPFNARAVAGWAHLDAPGARKAFHEAFADVIGYLDALHPEELYRPIPRPSGGSTTAANSVRAIIGHRDEHCTQLCELVEHLPRG